MNILSIPTGTYQEICYLVWSNDNKAIVFDPGFDADYISQTLKDNGLEVAAYVLTHTHFDHINALADLHDAAPAPIVVHSKDWGWAFSPTNQGAPDYPCPRKPDAANVQWLESAADWTFADLTFQCLETPGHTPGGCCLLFPEGRIMITGDTLFKGSCGRTDLPGGSSRQLKESLKMLRTLEDDIQIFPGHGHSSTIGKEKATNFFMQ